MKKKTDRAPFSAQDVSHTYNTQGRARRKKRDPAGHEKKNDAGEMVDVSAPARSTKKQNNR